MAGLGGVDLWYASIVCYLVSILHQSRNSPLQEDLPTTIAASRTRTHPSSHAHSPCTPQVDNADTVGVRTVHCSVGSLLLAARPTSAPYRRAARRKIAQPYPPIHHPPSTTPPVISSSRLNPHRRQGRRMCVRMYAGKSDLGAEKRTCGNSSRRRVNPVILVLG